MTAKLLRDGGGRTVPDLGATVLAKRGHNSLNLSAGSGRFIGYESGYDRITAEPGSLLREYRRKVNHFSDSNPFVSVALASEPSDDRAVRLNQRPFALGFVEYRPDGRMTATLDVQNLFFTPSVSERLLFGSSRGSSDVTMREYRERNDRLRMTLILKRTFGGSSKVKPSGK